MRDFIKVHERTMRMVQNPDHDKWIDDGRPEPQMISEWYGSEVWLATISVAKVADCVTGQTADDGARTLITLDIYGNETSNELFVSETVAEVMARISQSQTDEPAIFDPYIRKVPHDHLRTSPPEQGITDMVPEGQPEFMPDPEGPAGTYTDAQIRSMTREQLHRAGLAPAPRKVKDSPQATSTTCPSCGESFDELRGEGCLDPQDHRQ